MSDSFTLDNLDVNSYKIEITKLPLFNYKVKNVETPTVSLQGVEVPNPYQKMIVPGDTLNYTPISITFLVDENLYNYTAILHWLEGLGFPDSFEQFKELASNTDNPALRKKSYAQRETCDITLHMLTNHRNSNRVLKLYNAFPITLSGISFTNSNTDAEVFEASVDFAFTGMKYII